MYQTRSWDTVIKMKMSLFVFGLISLLGFAQTGDNRAKWIQSLHSENEAERESVAVHLVSERDATIGAIEATAKQFVTVDDRKGIAKAAIRLLGELKAEQSVSVLVENLTFEVFYQESKRLQITEDLFPCVGALIKIGIPSIQPVLDKAKFSSDPKALLAATAVVRGVLGDNLGKARLELELRTEPDQARHQRLSSMLESLGVR
jgi:hypothetical protein